MRNDFIPIIFGGDISAYSLAREFHEAYGVTSVALTTAKGSVNQYTSIMNTVVDENLLDPQCLIKHVTEIKNKNPEKILLIQGCRDWQVRMIIENKEALEKLCLVPYIDEGLLNSIVRKNDFYGLCEKYEMDHPKTYVYDFASGGANKEAAAPEQTGGAAKEEVAALEIPSDMGLVFPIIAKPSDSVEYYNVSFEGQKKVFIIDNEDELKDLLIRVKESCYKGKFILQDFIPGDDSNMRVLTCYSDKKGQVRFAALGHTLLEDQEENSIGNPVAIINERINEESPVYIQAKRFLEGVGYTGFANFDIKYDDRDGKYKFFEINTRLGASSMYLLAGGRNPVKWIVEELIDGKEFSGFETTEEEGLYTKVHKSNILAYLKDEVLKKKVDVLYSINKVIEPLNYSGDKSFLHKVYANFFMNRQKKRFEEYFRSSMWNDIEGS